MTENNSAQVQQHVTKVSEALTKENRLLQIKLEEMEKERKAMEDQRKAMEEERHRADEERKALEAKFNEANSHVERIKLEKRAQLERVLKDDVNPYLQQLAESNKDNARLIGSIENFRKTTEHDLDSGEFLNAQKENNLLLVHAMASAGQVTSSKLNEIFQARKEWEKTMEELKLAKEEDAKKHTVFSEEKLREIEELKKQLESIKGNIKNVDSHFDENTKDMVIEGDTYAAEQPHAITAVASNASASSGYKSLYEIKPISWRSMCDNAASVMSATSAQKHF